jgi:hypothetical protein
MEGRSILGIAAGTVAAVIGFTAAAERNEAGEIVSAGSVGAFEAQVGDCFDDEAFESDEISEIPAVPCSQEHDNEIYAAFDVAGEWPGDERIEELAYEGCLSRFAGAIGKAYEDSEIEFTTMYPSEGSWNNVDDREVLCVGYHMELEKLTGTIRGSRR